MSKRHSHCSVTITLIRYMLILSLDQPFQRKRYCQHEPEENRQKEQHNSIRRAKQLCVGSEDRKAHVVALEAHNSLNLLIEK